MRSILGGDSASVVSYGSADGVEGCLAAFDAACKSPLLGPDRVRVSRGLMESVEARPGILKDKDTHVVRGRMAEIASDGAMLHLNTVLNENLRSDYRVTILSQG